MKNLIFLVLLYVGLFCPYHSAMASSQLKTEDIASIEINRLSVGSRIFRENDGYEEPVVRKVVEWLNAANPLQANKDNGRPQLPFVVLKINMKNGDVATLEPAFHCMVQNETKNCTLANGEVLYRHNKQTDRIKSVELFDWLLAGWKFENVEPPKDSYEIVINDILMVLIGDSMEKAVDEYYSAYLTVPPLVYPYEVEIVDVNRIGGFRTFHFFITLEATPVVGPHISVGKDRLTFEIAPTIPGQIKLKKYVHLETHMLPPNWQHIMKNTE